MGEAVLKLAAKEPPRYTFTNEWFQETATMVVWDQIIETVKPERILEIGSYEGRATTFLIEKCSAFGPVSVTCVDPWVGSKDLPPELMRGVEDRFDQNIAAALEWAGNATVKKIKAKSAKALPHLLSEGQQFDLIYVDGSHTAPDVLTDAVNSFHLLREGGGLVFDDYVWFMEGHGHENMLNCPKLAIDAFVNIYIRQLQLMYISGQVYMMKTHDA